MTLRCGVTLQAGAELQPMPHQVPFPRPAPRLSTAFLLRAVRVPDPCLRLCIRQPAVCDLRQGCGEAVSPACRDRLRIIGPQSACVVSLSTEYFITRIIRCVHWSTSMCAWRPAQVRPWRTGSPGLLSQLLSHLGRALGFSGPCESQVMFTSPLAAVDCGSSPRPDHVQHKTDSPYGLK